MNTLNKLYQYFEKVTPLSFDCGELCGAKCCKGDKDNGMILFPGEEEFFLADENFRVFYDKRYDCNIVSCKGFCSRTKRPLSCRIFPFLFYKTDAQSSCKSGPDIRALDFCPIFDCEISVDRQFLRYMRIASKLIDSDEEFSAFIIKLTSLLSDMNGL